MGLIDISDSQIEKYISGKAYDDAVVALTWERYDRAIEIISNAIGEAQEEFVSGISVFTAVLLMAKCYRWKGDLDTLEKLISLLRQSQEWRETDPDVMILLASKSQHIAKSYADLFTEIDIHESVKQKDFSTREKLLVRGIGQLRLGQLDKAIDNFEIGYLFSALTMDHRLVAENANCLGLCYLGVGNLRHALEWFKKAYEVGRKINSIRRLGISSLNLGVCMYKIGDYRTSQHYLETAVRHLEQA
ncbi:MAG: tetratricopeptide repeat-containing serine/threonine-protein kinase [Candidatus Krumholzibacteria bacterium]|nr:tetratricopeptide repeat-containing serine/threonine-protein kinase [Candidatus Krumholzibacteria bacterium]